MVSGCSSNTVGLSNQLSYIIESVSLKLVEPFEIISSEDMLAHFENYNEEIKQKLSESLPMIGGSQEEYVLLGTDVTALFPSLSAEKTSNWTCSKMNK